MMNKLFRIIAYAILTLSPMSAWAYDVTCDGSADQTKIATALDNVALSTSAQTACN